MNWRQFFTKRITPSTPENGSWRGSGGVPLGRTMTAEDLGRLIAGGRGAAEVSAYLAAGGDVNATEPRSGMPLLHLASEHQNSDAIRALVAAGADVNAGDAFGQTPLHVAVDSDIDAVVQACGPLADMQFATARLLLDLGADHDARDSAGRSSRDV